MDTGSALRLKEETIRLKKSIELHLESIKMTLEAIDLKLEAVDAEDAEKAEKSHPGMDASGEGSAVEEQSALVAALTWEQRRDNFIKNLYPRWKVYIGYSAISFIEDIAKGLGRDELSIGLWGCREHDAFDALGGGTVLHWAVRMEDPVVVTRILATSEVDVNVRDKVWEATALHWAARIGNIAIVKVMLNDPSALRKFDLRVRDQWGFTALECAIFNGIKPKIFTVTELLKFKDSYHGFDDREGVIGEVEKILQEGGSSIEVESRLESQRETWYDKISELRGTYLHWAVKMEDTALAAHILETNVENIHGQALSVAVGYKNLDIVKLMVAKHLERGNFYVNHVDCLTGYTALHWAVVCGEEENTRMVKELLRCEATMRLTEECDMGFTPLQIAHERGFKDIEKTLMEREGVRRYVEELYRDRQVYVDAANAILVGAALIASVTFASWLQPPLGYTPDYANVQEHVGLRAFWVFNCLSFYFAIATVVFGARSVLPRSNYFIKVTVEKLRKNLSMTAILLACSVFFVIVAFGIAGCIVLTPIVKFQMFMIVPTIFGGLLCLTSLGLLSYSMWEDSLGSEHALRRKLDWSRFNDDAYKLYYF